MSEILVENIDFDSIQTQIITEDVNDKPVRRHYIIGPHLDAEVKNGNGRIYPKAVVEREVNRLTESKIKQSRFVGELNHPSCHTKTAKILTTNGWKYLKDISEKEIVYTLNIETNNIEPKQIERKIAEPYKGKMYRVKQRNLDTVVTPNHRFLTVNRYGKYEYITAEDLYSNPTKYSHSYIPKLGNWEADSNDTFILKGLTNIPKKGNYNIDPESTSEINMLTFVRFLGIWLSEGYVINIEEKQGNGYSTQIGITQKDEQTINEIRQMLKSFPPEMEWKEYISKNGTHTFKLLDLRLSTYLRDNFGHNCYTKKIETSIKQLSSCYLEELLYWYQKGDGRYNIVGDYVQQNVFTVSEQLILDLNEILFKTGGSGNITKNECNADYYFAEHLIKAENKVPLYQLNFSTTKGIHLDKRFLTVELIEDYNDFVYCVSVENQNFYCMDNGKTFWSGNSIEVNLERVSHLVKELKMEGNIAVGKSLLLDTPMGKIAQALVDGGVKIGVSSRGVGTLKESIVQNDYRLVCIDIVSEPSGPNCIVDNIMENKEWVFENGILSEKEREIVVAEVERVIIENQFSKEDRNAALLKMFNDVLVKIKHKHI